MKTKGTKTAHGPQCRKCGATDIEFTYTEINYGHEIDERTALETACYIIGSAIKAETDQDCDAEQLAIMSTTLARLATMLKVRKAGDAEETAETLS